MKEHTVIHRQANREPNGQRPTVSDRDQRGSKVDKQKRGERDRVISTDRMRKGRQTEKCRDKHERD